MNERADLGRVPARVVSFDSNKGGVGRSFLLANSAILLARWGWRVLCIDWDLEAPGLHRYFEELLPDTKHWSDARGAEVRGFVAKGIVDLAEQVASGAGFDWKSVCIKCSLPRRSRHETAPTGTLDLIPAGAVDQPGYGKRVTDLDWRVQFEQHRFGSVLEAARREWTADYDIVLVDSRTGITDAGGICTVLLPDILVFVFTANMQSLRGAADVARSVRTQHKGLPLDRSQIQLVPVASRFDARSEVELARVWAERFEQQTREFTEPWLPRDEDHRKLLSLLRVGYFSRWTFGEPLPALTEAIDNHELVTYVLANLAALLIKGPAQAAGLVEDRQKFIVTAEARTTSSPGERRASRFEFDLFISYAREDASFAKSLHVELERRQVKVWLDSNAIQAGANFVEALNTALSRAESMVLLWGDNESRWQWTEMSAILAFQHEDRTRRVFPVRRGARELPALLAGIQMLDGRRLSPVEVAEQIAPLVRAATHSAQQADTEEQTHEEPLVTYRRRVAESHRRLVPFAPELSSFLLQDIVVQIDLLPGDLEARVGREKELLSREWTHGRTTLHELLVADVKESRKSDFAPKWLVQGDPGAGKTTMARDLVRELAEAAEGPLPIFASSADFGAASGDVHTIATRDLGEVPETTRARFRKELTAALRRRSGVWLFLDGFDEVPPDTRDATWRIVERFAADHPRVLIVVLARPVAFERRPVWTGFRSARVQGLDPARQRELASHLVGAEVGGPLLDAVERNPRLGELAKSPLLLTLLCFVGREALADGRAVPTDLGRLLREALSLLIGKGFAMSPRGMKDEVAARALLQALSRELHARGGEVWTRTELSKALWAVRQGAVDLVPDHGQLAFQLASVWGGSNDAFLDEVSRVSGILGPHDAERGPWRYLHRALREQLAAERLAQLPDQQGERLLDAWLVRAAADPKSQEVAQWAEVWSYYLAETNAPSDRFERLIAVSRDVGLRSLRTQEHMAAADELRLAVNALQPDDDNVDLAGTVARMRAEGVPDDLLSEVILGAVDAEKPTAVLARLFHALETSGVEVDRAEFFRACDRWPETGEPGWPTVVRIPPGDGSSVSFQMGTTKGGYDQERPVRKVTLTSYQMATTTVTEADYMRFDPKRSTRSPRKPVAGVSWWEAWLYARWVGGRLPTEAEWECACRAGTTTLWSHGNDEAQLEKHAWFDKNSRNEAHEVAKLQPNPWALYDMHGNVWEWCQDWLGDYDPEERQDPRGPASGVHRVSRGGSAWDVAVWCRSACRNGWRPSFRFDFIGFRVVFPCS